MAEAAMGDRGRGGPGRARGRVGAGGRKKPVGLDRGAPPAPRRAEDGRHGDWAVQAGAFRDRGQAEGLRKHLAGAGLDAYLLAVPGESAGRGRPGRILIGRDEIAARVADLGQAVRGDYAGRSPLLVAVLKGAV